MLFDPASAAHLKPWLIRTLEPICDAEPGALADYILALLKHNVPEHDMRTELAVQLAEFLEKECPNFIDTLFTVLRTKSFLPYAPADALPLDTGIPIPLDALLSPSIPSPDRTRKRSTDDDERDGRPPAKGPRLSTDGQFSRYQNGRPTPDARSTGAWGQRPPNPINMAAMASMNMAMNAMPPIINGRNSYQPPDPKRGICRDYHNNGYCARGAYCKYSHGDDAVVPGQLFPPAMPSAMPFMPMFPNGGVPFGMPPNGTYDPHEARMDMRPQTGNTPMPGARPQTRAPVLPRLQQDDGSRVVHSPHASGELPVIQDLTPKVAGDDAPQPDPQYTSQPPPPQQYGQEWGNGGEGMPGLPRPDVEMAPPHPHPGGFRGRNGNSGARGRGTFGGEVHSFRPERRDDKTLVVEKIPEDKLTLEAVNGWFKRFGTVTNVAIDAAGGKALVSFAAHDEAHAAWKSEDAVFGNRFVKLFWHRPMEGHGHTGARLLAASAPLVAHIAKEPAPKLARPAASTSAPPAKRKASAPSAAASALAAKQQLLEQQIAEQRALMASLETASAEEKKTIMARLRKLGEDMKPAPAPAPASAPAAPVATPRRASVAATDHERKERERLDKELELHSATVAADAEEESPEDLKAKLERLKAEAASLGLSDATEAPYGGAPYRPYRGRGRGARGYFRGNSRGGPPPRASMKLDNRPKTLVVKGAGADALPALREWYETTGQVDTVDASENGDVVVSFKTRAGAEQGLAKGTTIPAVGAVTVAWLAGGRAPGAKAHAASPTPAAAPAAEKGTGAVADAEADYTPAVHAPHVPEEEVVASGWGGDGDGEDGMGML